LSTDDPDTIIFRLKKGRLVQDNPGFATPRTLSFESYDLPINLPSIDPFRGRGNEEKELILPELIGRAYGGTAETRKDEIAARANLHFRLVEVVMMLMLPLLAIALAIPPKRSTSSLGIFIGIVMVVTYHKINQYAESAGAQGRLQPELALWLPFLVFVALIFWMYHVIAHRPGGQPIGALEAAFAKIGKLVRKALPKSRFQRAEAA
jgi:lipopolysaccharide export system permease protein